MKTIFLFFSAVFSTDGIFKLPGWTPGFTIIRYFLSLPNTIPRATDNPATRKSKTIQIMDS